MGIIQGLVMQAMMTGDFDTMREMSNRILDIYFERKGSQTMKFPAAVNRRNLMLVAIPVLLRPLYTCVVLRARVDASMSENAQ